MLRFLFALLILVAVTVAESPAQEQTNAPAGQVLKVLPQLLDKQGRHTVSPSLFDRDAYQAHLRANPAEVSGIRYAVNWKAKQAKGRQLTVRVELRGLHEDKVPHEAMLETTVNGKTSMRKWTNVKMTGEEFTDFGKVTAWRATLWCDGTLLDEYKSFLW